MNVVNAKIDCAKETVSINFGDISHEFNFSKFCRKPHDKELSSINKITGLSFTAAPPTDLLEQYFIDHENDMHMNERNEIDKMFIDQPPIIKHNFPVATLGGPPPTKGDLVFELIQLHDTLKYAYLDEKKIYHVI